MINNKNNDNNRNNYHSMVLVFGVRQNLRALPYVPKAAIPHVPDLIGVQNIRARPLPAPPVREQQQVMLPEDDMLVNQPFMQQHNLQQHNIA